MYYFETTNRLESCVKRPETHPMGNISKLVWRHNPGGIKASCNTNSRQDQTTDKPNQVIEFSWKRVSSAFIRWCERAGKIMWTWLRNAEVPTGANWSFATSMKRDVMGFEHPRSSRKLFQSTEPGAVYQLPLSEVSSKTSSAKISKHQGKYMEITATPKAHKQIRSS